MADLDRAVGNVLRLKFQMGLFENPYVSPELAKKLVHSKEHKELARQVAREGVVLLKNEGVLPLSKHIGHLAVIGLMRMKCTTSWAIIPLPKFVKRWLLCWTAYVQLYRKALG